MNESELNTVYRALLEADMWIAQVQAEPVHFADLMGKAIDIVSAKVEDLNR